MTRVARGAALLAEHERRPGRSLVEPVGQLGGQLARHPADLTATALARVADSVDRDRVRVVLVSGVAAQLERVPRGHGVRGERLRVVAPRAGYAQRSADDSAGDGPRNVSDAVKLASSPLAHGLGAMVMFEQHFHAARDVTKSHSARVDTFVSRSNGKLGEIDGSIVSVSRRPTLRKSYAADKVEPRVDLIKLVLGSDDRFIRYAAASGARAIVLEAFGRGNATPAIAAAVRDIIADGVPVVVTSRCGAGRVKPIYGNGGGKDLERAGAIFAGDLTGPKARIVVSLLLGMEMTIDEMRQEILALGG